MISAERPTKVKPWLASIVLVGGGGEARRDGLADGVGHLLHPHRQGDVAGAGGHRQRRRAHRGAARGAGGLDLPRLDRQQAGGVGEEGGDVLLGVDGAAEHVAGVEGAHRLQAGVGEGGADRRRAELAQAQVPVLAHRRLADADDEDVSHDSADLSPQAEVVAVVGDLAPAVEVVVHPRAAAALLDAVGDGGRRRRRCRRPSRRSRRRSARRGGRRRGRRRGRAARSRRRRCPSAARAGRTAICAAVKPSSAAARSTNFGTGWWKTAWA